MFTHGARRAKVARSLIDARGGSNDARGSPLFLYFYISIFLYFYISIFLYFYISITEKRYTRGVTTDLISGL